MMKVLHFSLKHKTVVANKNGDRLEAPMVCFNFAVFVGMLSLVRKAASQIRVLE